MLLLTLRVGCLDLSVGDFHRVVEQQHGRLVVLAMWVLGSQ
jgi:hypothetical protein